MHFALTYALARFVFRVLDFFHHWYEHGTRRFAHAYLSLMESLDRTFAVAITVRHFFEPLYGDYSIIGRLLGLVFRPIRILLGLGVYLVVAAVFLAAYLVWIGIPPLILVYVFKHLP